MEQRVDFQASPGLATSFLMLAIVAVALFFCYQGIVQVRRWLDFAYGAPPWLTFILMAVAVLVGLAISGAVLFMAARRASAGFRSEGHRRWTAEREALTKRVAEQNQSLVANWENAYYCRRHDVVFVSGSARTSPPPDFQQFLRSL
jgi:hypothetical protein